VIITVAVTVSAALAPAMAEASINPLYCGQGVPFISGGAVGSRAQAVGANPYRVVATYYYKQRKQPQDTRVMRLGTSSWGFIHIRNGRGWSSPDTYVIVGCVLTYGRPVKREGHSYTFRFRFPSWAPAGKATGREFEVIYETSGGPKGVITAYSTDMV
jgi:hypothetical protein